MCDLQTALGVSQLQRLDTVIQKRVELAGRCDEWLQRLPVKTPYRASQERSSLHYIPIYRQPFYQNMQWSKILLKKSFTEAGWCYKEAITLPLYPGLTEKEQMNVVSTLEVDLEQ